MKSIPRQFLEISKLEQIEIKIMTYLLLLEMIKRRINARFLQQVRTETCPLKNMKNRGVQNVGIR